MVEIEKIDIQELIPQYPPFVLIDKLIRCDNSVTITQTKVDRDNIFLDNDYITAYGIIENIAQTCAVRIGYLGKYVQSVEKRYGVVGSIHNFVLYRRPKVNEILTTSIEVVNEVFNITIIKASVKSSNDLISTAEMKLALSS